MSFPCEAETQSTVRAGAPAGEEDEPSGGGGALAYARECEAELGPVPGFDCADGLVVPVTVDGLVVGEDQEAASCDAPSIAEGDCNVVESEWGWRTSWTRCRCRTASSSDPSSGPTTQATKRRGRLLKR